MNIHRLNVVVYIAQAYLSANKCCKGAATADVWASEMKTKWPLINTNMFVTDTIQ